MKKLAKTAFSLFLLAFILTFIALHGLTIPTAILSQLPKLVTIFLSIIIQALPFVLIGVFGSALMQNLITPEMVERKLTRTRKLPGILFAIGAGFFFPVCDCGVIPVVRRLLLKKVPPYMAIAFLVTAPLVNPITVWATATAFGYNLPITLLRVGMAVGIGIIVAMLSARCLPTLNEVFSAKALREMSEAAANETTVGEDHDHTAHAHGSCVCQQSRQSKIGAIFEHANEEFLEVGKFLIIGSLIAATIQTMVPKQALMVFTQNPVLSVAVMMLLALSLSLCAEADAFVARSFTLHFPMGSVMAFMVFGQMLDIKNALLLLKSFRLKALLLIFGCCALLVLIVCSFFNLLAADRLLWGRF